MFIYDYIQEIDTFIYQEWINALLLNFLFIKESWKKYRIMVSKKIIYNKLFSKTKKNLKAFEL